MKNLQKRLNQLYEQQAIEEKKVIQALQNTLDNINPIGNIKQTLDAIISGEKEDAYYSKNALTILINKTVDGIIKKPEIINQAIKILLKNRFIDVLYSKEEKPNNNLVKVKKESCSTVQE